ncbi:hypothetical protein OROGR_025307 [Orobanche gracilis]
MGGPKRRLKKVDAGSILTTLFAVSCFASMEELMAATLIHNAQRESKGQPKRLRYHYFTTGSGGNGPGVLATSFYLIADEVVTYYKGAKMMKPYSDKLSLEKGSATRMFF